MNGFYISVSNGLIEDKHRVAMGEAIWLYMLLLDKMTSVSEAGEGKVLGGKPLKHKDILEYYPLLPRITYVRYLSILKSAGYITTTRTPYGLIIKVLKAKKIFNRDVSKTIQPDVSNMKHHPTKRSIKNDTSVSKNDTSNKTRQLDKTINTTNVVFGKPEINELFTYWQKTTGLQINSRLKQNRYAASNLLKKHGRDNVRKLIDISNQAHQDQYAPQIADFCGLQSKLNHLLVWAKRQALNNKPTIGVVR